MRCGQRLSACSTSDCTAELHRVDDGEGGRGADELGVGGKASGDTSRTPGQRVCERPQCAETIPEGSRPEARYCNAASGVGKR